VLVFRLKRKRMVKEIGFIFLGKGEIERSETDEFNM